MRIVLKLIIAVALCLTIPAYAQMTLTGAGGVKKPAGGGGGSVTFDAGHAAVTATSGTTLTWTHTPVGTPTGVAVAVCVVDGLTNGTATATYGGTSMTVNVQAIDHAAVGSYMYIFGLANPPSGPQTVTVTTNNTITTAVGTSISVTNSNLTTVFSNTAAQNVTTSAATSVTVTSATGELVYDAACSEANSTTLTITGSQTAVMSNGTAGQETLSASRSPGAATVTPTYSISASTQWLAAAASFKH